MNKIINTAFVAFALAAGAASTQASAHTVWRFPYKGASYAVPHTHTNGNYTVRSARECPRTVIRRSFRSKVTPVCPDQ